MGVEEPSARTFFNVSFIVIGVIIASFGEIDFVLIGFLYQMGGILFESIRINLVHRLLNGSEFKMDPLVSLYYFAPVCAIMNLVVGLFWEVPKIQMSEIYAVGLWTFFANAMCAFALNVSVVFLVSIYKLPYPLRKLITYPDRQDLRPRPHALRCPQGHSSRCCFRHHLGNHDLRSSDLRLHHRSLWHALLQARSRCHKGLFCRWGPPMGRIRCYTTGSPQDPSGRNGHCHDLRSSRRLSTILPRIRPIPCGREERRGGEGLSTIRVFAETTFFDSVKRCGLENSNLL